MPIVGGVLKLKTAPIGKGVDTLIRKIRECLSAGGIPQIVPEYGGREFRGPDDSPAVLFRCWGASREVKGGVIYGLPAELVEKAKETVGDYRWILEEYGKY